MKSRVRHCQLQRQQEIGKGEPYTAGSSLRSAMYLSRMNGPSPKIDKLRNHAALFGCETKTP